MSQHHELGGRPPVQGLGFRPSVIRFSVGTPASLTPVSSHYTKTI